MIIIAIIIGIITGAPPYSVLIVIYTTYKFYTVLTIMSSEVEIFICILFRKIAGNYASFTYKSARI